MIDSVVCHTSATVCLVKRQFGDIEGTSTLDEPRLSKVIRPCIVKISIFGYEDICRKGIYTR